MLQSSLYTSERILKNGKVQLLPDGTEHKNRLREMATLSKEKGSHVQRDKNNTNYGHRI